MSAVSYYASDPVVKRCVPTECQHIILFRSSWFGLYLVKNLLEFLFSVTVVLIWFLTRHWDYAFILHVSDPHGKVTGSCSRVTHDMTPHNVAPYCTLSCLAVHHLLT